MFSISAPDRASVFDFNIGVLIVAWVFMQLSYTKKVIQARQAVGKLEHSTQHLKRRERKYDTTVHQPDLGRKAFTGI